MATPTAIDSFPPHYKIYMYDFQGIVLITLYYNIGYTHRNHTPIYFCKKRYAPVDFAKCTTR